MVDIGKGKKYKFEFTHVIDEDDSDDDRYFEGGFYFFKLHRRIFETNQKLKCLPTHNPHTCFLLW